MEEQSSGTNPLIIIRLEEEKMYRVREREMTRYRKKDVVLLCHCGLARTDGNNKTCIAMELNVDEPKRSHEERTSSLHIESRAEERDS